MMLRFLKRSWRAMGLDQLEPFVVLGYMVLWSCCSFFSLILPHKLLLKEHELTIEIFHMLGMLPVKDEGFDVREICLAVVVPQ